MKKIMIISMLLVCMLTGCQRKQGEVKNKTYGYIDQNGYIEIRKNGKLGLMNTEGDIVLPCEYELIFPVDAYYFISKNDIYGVIDKDLDERLPIKYERIAYVKDTHSFFAREKDKTVVFDEEGKQKKIIDGALSKLKFDSDLLMVDKEGKRALINHDGDYVSDYIYDYDTWFPKIQTDGKRLITVASKDGKAGVLDRHGKEIIAFVYDYIQPITDFKDVSDDSGYTGYFQAVKDGKSGIIDINGNVIVAFAYDAYMGNEDTRDNKASIRNGVGFYLSRNGYEVFVDMQGKEIVNDTVEKDSVSPIQNDEDGFHLYLGNETTYYDMKGNIKQIVEGRGDCMEDGVALINQTEGSIIINEQGKVLYKSDTSNIKRIKSRFLDGDSVIDQYGNKILSVKNAQVVYIELNDMDLLAVENKKQKEDKVMTILYDMDGNKVMDIYGVVSSINLNPFGYDTITIYDKHDIKSKKGVILPKKKKQLAPVYEAIVEKDDYYCAHKKDGTSVLIDKETLEVVFETEEEIVLF